MEITKEMMDKAKAAKTAEELMELAKAEGIEMEKGEAEATFAQLHKNGELADEELDNVTGGGCVKGADSPFKVGEEVLVQYYDKWLPATILQKQTRGWACWHLIVYKESGEKLPWVPTHKIRKLK